jgi:tetratricopeptide (TPR) repeat protein
VRQTVLEHGRGWATLGLGRASEARRHFLEFARLAGELGRTHGAERETALPLIVEYFQRPWSDVVMQRPAGIFPRGSRLEAGAEVHAEALHCCCHVASLEDDGEALLEHARALDELARGCQSAPRRAEALAWRGAHALLDGHAPDARALIDQALELARSVGHERAERMALELRARLHAQQGELAAAQQAYELLLTRVPAAETAGAALVSLGEVRARRGLVGSALEAYGQAAQVRQRIRPGYPAVHGWLLRELGRPAAARQLDEAALRPLGDLGQTAALSRVLSSLAITTCRQGQLAAAQQHLRDAEALVPNAHGSCSWRRGHLWSARCELLLAQGDSAALLQTADTWLHSARARGDVEGVSQACRYQSHALFRVGEPRRARELAEAARDATGVHPLPFSDYRACALLARLSEHAGDGEGAAAARREARAHVQVIARELADDSERRQLERLVEQELQASLLAPALATS